MSPRVAIVLNGYNLRRFRRDLPDRLCVTARRCGYEPHVDISLSLEHYLDLVGRAVERGADVLLTGGGDGSLHHTINHPGIGHVGAVGMLPLGTINAFLRSTGASITSPETALRQLLRGDQVDGHCGRVNGRRFACFASWGFDARVVHRNSPALKRVIRASSYGVTGIGELLRWRGNQNAGFLRADGARVANATSVVVSKIPNYAGVTCFAADLRDPTFDSVCVTNDGPLTLLGFAAYLGLKGPARGWREPRRVRRLPAVDLLEWRGRRPTHLQLDGEAVDLPDTARLIVEIDPTPQRYLVPKAY